MTRCRALLLALSLAPGPAGASIDCERLAAIAGREAGLPEGLLPAIARVESGHPTGRGEVRAWPWTLNQAGTGSFHDSKEAALDQLQLYLDAGIRNVDLGCMQLNWHWHGDAFANADEMMDPVANTRYAARFLRSLHDRLGSWDAAVAEYHSTEALRGAAYAGKVAAAMESRQDDAFILMAESAHAPRLAGLLALPSGPLLAAGGSGDLRAVQAAALLPAATDLP